MVQFSWHLLVQPGSFVNLLGSMLHFIWARARLKVRGSCVPVVIIHNPGIGYPANVLLTDHLYKTAQVERFTDKLQGLLPKGLAHHLLSIRSLFVSGDNAVLLYSGVDGVVSHDEILVSQVVTCFLCVPARGWH